MIWYANDRNIGKAATVCITGGFHMCLRLNNSQMFFAPKEKRHHRNRFLSSLRPRRRKWMSIGVRDKRLPIGGERAA